ncbi:MAG: hypothetical protein MUO67_00820 [Anaerolineales bacterium]|nr:hypothetical protein [Anaerolineales bacterium]
MNFKRSYLVTTAVLAVLVISGCMPGTSPAQLQAPDDVVPSETETSVQTPLPTQTSDPTLTHTPDPTPTPSPTPSPTLAPTLVPTQAVLTGIVRRLCPELRAPLGLFSVHEPFYDNSTDPATLYVLYQVVELGLDSSGEPCTFYLSPPPMGAPQFAGDSLFWKSFDYEAEWVMVWSYEPHDVLTDDVYPPHPHLRQTRTNTSIGKSGLFDFVVSEDGETLVWSYTDPQPYDDNEIGYVQSMYGAATSGPIDQRPPVDIWFDFVPEGDSAGKILRPREHSSDKEQLFYSEEPVGLGRQWPEPMGRYTSLYSISTWGDAYPERHFDCGRDYWCISDFSVEQDLLVTIQDNAIQITNLRGAELVRELQAPETYNLVRQALIGPDGTIAFLGAAIGESDYGDPPEDAAIFVLEPPYQGEPILVLADAGLLNLLGWASPSLLLADGNNLAENPAGNSTLPAHLMLVNFKTGIGVWLPLDADQFVALVP